MKKSLEAVAIRPSEPHRVMGAGGAWAQDGLELVPRVSDAAGAPSGRVKVSVVGHGRFDFAGVVLSVQEFHCGRAAFGPSEIPDGLCGREADV